MHGSVPFSRSALTSQRALWVLAAITLVGLVLRVVWAGEQALWSDEALTLVIAKWPVQDLLVRPVGANDPSARELDNVVLERAAFVCTDSRAQAREEAGDLIGPVGDGVLDWLEVHELQDVVAGEVTARSGDDDIVVFKSNGLAAWDLAAASRVVETLRS